MASDLSSLYHLTKDDEPSALSALKHFLPYSLTVYRRIQSERRTASARIVSTISASQLSKITSKLDLTDKCFGIAYVDRSVRPETESQIFLSSEATGRCSATCEKCVSILFSILGLTSSLPFVHPGSDNDYSVTSYTAHVSNPSLHLLGAVAEPVLEKLRGMHVLMDRGIPETPYSHIIFRSSDSKFSDVEENELPESLIYHPLTLPEHFSLVTRRTHIPRKISTLMALKSQALFRSQAQDKNATSADSSNTNMPIAWAFIGLDGSLTSLHVEEQWRGKGLAKKVGVKIVKESMRDDGYGHAYIAIDNIPSQAVCRSIGGTSVMQRYWVIADLDRVNKLIIEQKGQ
jgi:FR47-like protein